MPKWHPIRCEVMQVTRDGIIVMPFGYNRDWDKIQAPAAAYITNYPSANLAEGMELKLVAAELATPYRFVSTQGAVRTLKAYDFGLPFAGQANKTNIVMPSKSISLEAPQKNGSDAKRSGANQSTSK